MELEEEQDLCEPADVTAGLLVSVFKKVYKFSGNYLVMNKEIVIREDDPIHEKMTYTINKIKNYYGSITINYLGEEFEQDLPFPELALQSGPADFTPRNSGTTVHQLIVRLIPRIYFYTAYIKSKDGLHEVNENEKVPAGSYIIFHGDAPVTNKSSRESILEAIKNNREVKIRDIVVFRPLPQSVVGSKAERYLLDGAFIGYTKCSCVIDVVNGIHYVTRDNIIGVACRKE